MSQLLDILAADAAGKHAQSDAAFQALTAAKAAHPRFATTSCSQCGTSTGPGDGGFSRCAGHRARDAERAVLRTAAQAMNAALRPCFDPDYGSYTGSPLDPRSPCDCCDERLTADQAHDEAAEQILSFPESVADWLAKACDCAEGRLPLDVRDLQPLQIIEGSPALLLAVLMNGDNSQVLRAVHGLREMAGKHFAAQIDERAAELLAVPQ